MRRMLRRMLSIWLLVWVGVSLSMGAEQPQKDEKAKTPKAEEKMVKIKAIFGFSRTHTEFKDKKIYEITSWFKNYGVNAVFGGYEDAMLRTMLKNAGIKLYAEVALFVGQKYWLTHPESQPINAQGEPVRKQEWYAPVCPNQPWLWQEKLAEIEKLVKEYEVDGVWLDFIRYPCHWESVTTPVLEQSCFCPVCLELFEKRHSIQYPEEVLKSTEKDAKKQRVELTRKKAQWILRERREDFISWKNERIKEFVAKAAQLIKGINPQCKVGLFILPWKKEDFRGALREIVAQDPELLAPHVDVFSPMVYHLMLGKDVKWIGEITEYFARVTDKPVLPIIQACSEPKKLSLEEFKEAVETAYKSPHSMGVIVFNLSHTVKEDKLSGLRIKPE